MTQSENNNKGDDPGEITIFAKMWLLGRIAVWIAALPVLIRVMSLPRLMSLLTPRTPVRPFDPEMLVHGHRINSYVISILRRNPENMGKMCLRRSLILYRFLRICGIPASFHLGVIKDKEKLDGHSWIEINSEHYFDSRPDREYHQTFSYPG